MSLISDLFEIRSRKSFSANDITVWLISAFQHLYGIKGNQFKTEVIIKGKSSGRADIVVQDSVGIETKRSLIDEITDAEPQVKRILEKLEEEGDISPVGIATDGQSWRFYVLAGEELFNFHSFQLDAGSQDEELSDNIWVGLTTIRHKKDRPMPTAEAIAEAFRPSGPAFNEARSQLVAQVKYILEKNPIEFTSKFLPWFELFSFVYNNFHARCLEWANHGDDLKSIVIKLHKSTSFKEIDGPVLQGGIELFLRHTYLALLAKTLSALVTLGEDGLSKSLISSPDSIITGEAIAKAGIRTSDDNDFFVWLAHGSNPGKFIGTLLRALQRFSDEYSDDVFRHLYEGVVDANTRHELGEFFTPKWMAQLIIEDTIKHHSDRVLDPACGSGTFLVMALRKKASLLSKEGKISEHSFGQLLDEIWGIDVNPLSVILARTNLYLAIATILKGKQQLAEIRPRVYVADTLVLPRFSSQEQRQLADESSKSLIISAPVTPQISIPILLRLSPDEVYYWINKVGDLIEEGGSDIPPNTKDKDLIEYQHALLRTMQDLRRKYGNNLWKFVLRNYGIPPLLRGKFNVVVGNPPWLSFREARKSIQDNMETIASQCGVTPNSQTKTSFNLAVAFFFASSYFIKAPGRIGFVFPLSVLDSPAHEPFITLLTAGDRFNLVKAYDLEDIAPYPFPHSLPSAILVAEVRK